MPRAAYTTHAGELRPRRAALVGEDPFSQPHTASLSAQWITHAERSLLHQTLGQMTLCSARTAPSVELAAAELRSGGLRRRPLPTPALGRPI